MPCNLAVTITKAAVTEQRLLALLTDETVERVLTAYFQEQGQQAQITRTANGVQVRLNGITIRVTNGQVIADSRRTRRNEMGDLTDTLSTLLARAADALFAQQVGVALQGLSGSVKAQTVNVDNDGTVQQATVFTMQMGGR
jgi:hypothetical protein